jgi:hypothetical protein
VPLGCGDDASNAGGSGGGETGPSTGPGSGAGNQGGGGTGGDGQGGIGGAMGTLAVTLEADRGAADDSVVSLGVPFAPGDFADPSLLVVRDEQGTEIPAHAASLATWPLDGSQRSVLVAFRATIPQGETRSYTIDYGVPRTADAGVLAPNPDGPVAATLDPSWYASTRVLGYQVPASQNTAFAAWETEIEDYLASMSPPWESYGLSCQSTSAERTYYDGPHALYQRFAHRGSAAAYRRAREEAVWYRANEITWYAGDTVALYACAPGWDPNEPLVWGDMRRMLGQGMLDDYLMTGDPAALATVRGLGEAFRQDLGALTSGGEITVKVTERNMAWPMMGLASYYAVNPTTEVRAALQTLVDMTVAWQAEGTSGAFEHDINRPDPSECGDGPNGASPFMTSLLVDGLMDAYFMTGDATICPTVVAAAEWYRDDAITSDGVAFEYLWGCNDVDYDDSSTADLNLLISHVFGAAYLCSQDAAWLAFGDAMADNGVDNIYAGAPKQWSQSARTFMKYMGYRALALAP